METWREAQDQFDDMLNEIYGDVKIGYLTFQPARIMRELDPIAYRTGLFDWLDSEGIDSEDLEGELEV